jgi:hypothetical protein
MNDATGLLLKQRTVSFQLKLDQMRISTSESLDSKEPDSRWLRNYFISQNICDVEFTE